MRRHKALAFLYIVLISLAGRGLILWLREETPNIVSSSGFSVPSICILNIVVWSLAILGIIFVTFSWLKNWSSSDIWYIFFAEWLMVLWCPLLFLHASFLLFPRGEGPLPLGLVIIALSDAIGAFVLSGAKLSRRWFIGGLLGFGGWLYSALLGFFVIVSFKGNIPTTSIGDYFALAVVATASGIGGILGGLIADKVAMRAQKRHDRENALNP